MANTNDAALFRRLQSASNAGRSHLAIELGRRYVAACDTHAPAWLFYGRALVEAARYTEAKRAYTAGLSCCADDKIPVFEVHLGHLYELKGNYKLAEYWYRAAAKRLPPDAEERLLVGEILYRQGKLEASEKWFRRMIAEGNERLQEAYRFLGVVLSAREEYAEALTCFKRALSLDPEDAEVTSILTELRTILRERSFPRRPIN